jgi:FkbM family methyltransferase
MNIVFPDINVFLEITPTNCDIASFFDAFHSILKNTSIEREEIVRVKLSYIKTPLQIRVYTDDVLVLWQIFINKEYDFPIKIDPKMIIDGGAYTGLSTVFFANKFPEAKIIALEPDWSNYQLLEKNTSDYCGIELRNTAIWNKNSYLVIKDISQPKSALMVEEGSFDQQGSFMAITIGEILRNSGFDEIDILKLDIEGAEKEVFSHNCEEWLNKVNILIIELHDRMKEGCSKSFFSAIRECNFNKTFKGENIILIKPNLSPRFKVDFTCKLEDGTVWDTSLNREPLTFAFGDGQVISGLEQAVMRMYPGESQIIKISADNAFGPHSKDMIYIVGRDQLPKDLKLEIGKQLQINHADGSTNTVRVTDISKTNITVDANHPLAGKDLFFDIKLLEIM